MPQGEHYGAAVPAQADRISRAQGRAVQLPRRGRRARCRADAHARRRRDQRDQRRRQAQVLAVDRKQRRRNPAPPFTTSTLQQEASRKLGFSAQRTMRLAQQLYEGVDIGEGSVGLITYMRTDSVSLAAEAVHGDPRGDRAALRPGGRGRGSARLQDQVARTRRKRTRPSVRPRPRSCRPRSSASSIPISSSCIR